MNQSYLQYDPLQAVACNIIVLTSVVNVKIRKKYMWLKSIEIKALKQSPVTEMVLV